jgi:predicted PurR-regulated permease PerM
MEGMKTNPDGRERAYRAFVLFLVVVVSAVFLYMIRGFIVTVLMAAIFSALAYPLFTRVLPVVRGSRGAASVLTLLIVLLVVVVPLVLFLSVVAAEAVSISQSVTPWVTEQLREPGGLGRFLERVPYLSQLQEHFRAYNAQILEKLGELAGRVSSFLVNSLSAATKGTVGFFFQLFLMAYAMFFFLFGGGSGLRRALALLPLPESDADLLVGKFVSVARATLKGTFVVGLVQGGLAGLAFAVVGIHGATFWGTIMVVLSIIPGIGTALVWVPAVIFLFATGNTAAAIGLAIWCAVVVGTVDNFLRPKLVGADTKMPDLLILLSTFGGLSMVGAVGLVLGPIVAAVFIAVWQIYGKAFGDVLAAEAAPVGDPGGEVRPPERSGSA